MNLEIFQKQGKFLILALDHRSSLKKILNEGQIIEIKRGIISSLKEQMSGVLIDPVFGLTAYKNLKSNIPFLLPMEKSGHKQGDSERRAEIEYPAGKIKSLNASGAKLLLYFNPFNNSAETQIEIAKQAIEEAHKNDLPLFLEILTFQPESKDVKRGDLIIESLQMFLEKGAIPDVFKLEYPGGADECKNISELLGQTKWVLLSAGKGFAQYQEQLKDAMVGGASGFLAGRALWQEIIDLTGNDKQNEKKEFLQNTLSARFRELSEIVNSSK